MNKNIYILLGTMVGMAAGSATTYVLMKKKFEQKLNDRIADMDSYSDMVEEYKKDSKTNSEEISDYDSYPSKEVNETDKEKALAQIKDKIKKNNEGIEKIRKQDFTPYNKAWEGKGDITKEEEKDEVPFEENVNPNEVEEDEDEDVVMEQYEKEDEVTLREAIEDRKKNKGRAPRIISVSKLDELGPTWDNKLLTYYPESDTVLDEDGNLVDEYHDILGDCLEKYDFKTNGKNETIFVQNFELDTVYEVLKDFSEL